MIYQLTFDWQPNNIYKGVAQYRLAQVGQRLMDSWNRISDSMSESGPIIERIIEHSAKGEGDRWYYDIIFDDGSIMRTFNPCTAYYDKEEKKKDDDLPF